MATSEFCVYNETRESFLSPRVSVIDTRSDPLKTVKILIEGLAPNANAGLWLNPLKNVPTVPRLSAYDLVYLDRDARVLHHVELIPDDEVPPFAGSPSSVLLLPLHTFAASEVRPGDRVVMRASDEAEAPQPSAIAPPPDAGPAPSSTGLATLHPLAWSTQLETIEPVQPPLPAKQRFRFLRSLTRLRVHIQISITTAPAPFSDRQTSTRHAPAPSHTFARPTPRPSRSAPLRARTFSALRSPIAKSASFVRRQARRARTAYVRWADAFVFGRSHSQSVDRVSRIGRSVLDAIFPH